MGEAAYNGRPRRERGGARHVGRGAPWLWFIGCRGLRQRMPGRCPGRCAGPGPGRCPGRCPGIHTHRACQDKNGIGSPDSWGWV